MANEFVIQHGLVINNEKTTDLSVIGFDNNDGAQIGKLVYDHATNTFIMDVNGTAQIQATSTTVLIAGDTTITGNLTVNGTTTTVSSANTVVGDNTITLNDGEVGAGVTAGAAGILIDRGSETDAGWFFNETDDWWGPTGPGGIAGEGGATQKIGNIAIIDSTDAPQGVLTFTSTGAIIPPSGTTLERPATPSDGMTRYSSSLSSLEIYNGSDWAKVVATVSGTPTALTGDIDLVNTYRLLNPVNPTTGNEVGDRAYNDGRYMRGFNNFSEIVADGSIATARTTIDVYSKAEAVAVAGDTMTGALNMSAAINMSANILPAGGSNIRDIGASGNVFANMWATTFNGTATNALYADLSERYEADEIYEPGTVVIFGGEKEVTLTSEYGDTRVAGVISTDPAFRMNDGAGSDETHPHIALKGKVPCKVLGPIKKGDLLITSYQRGFAVSSEQKAAAYTAFARANEDFDGETGVINVSII